MAVRNHLISTSFIAAFLTVTLSACGDQKKTSGNNESEPSVAPASASAPVAAENVTGPMSGDELVWLEGIAALHKSMDDVLASSPTALTPDSMRSMAKKFGGCASALDRLGPPTGRLREVHDLARQGCTRYADAGKCFTTAARFGTVVQGSGDEKRQTDAMNCGFAKPGDGSKLFADAEVKGFDVKESAH